MNKFSFAKAATNSAAIGKESVWQASIADLYKNYTLVELMLCQPEKLSVESLKQYRNLQRVMLRTMEQFMSEIDELDSKRGLHSASIWCVLIKHAGTLNKLNALVSSLLKEQFMAQA